MFGQATPRSRKKRCCHKGNSNFQLSRQNSNNFNGGVHCGGVRSREGGTRGKPAPLPLSQGAHYRSTVLIVPCKTENTKRKALFVLSLLQMSFPDKLIIIIIVHGVFYHQPLVRKSAMYDILKHN